MNKSDTSRPFSRFLLFIALFTIVFFALRAPFFSNRLFGEDGMAIDLFANHIRPMSYGQIGRVNGQPIYVSLWHPVTSYMGIAWMGDLARLFFNFDLIPQQTSIIVTRVGMSLFSYSFWILLTLLLYICQKKIRRSSILPFIAILILANSSFGIDSSLLIRVDNTTGAILPGLFAMTLAVYSYHLVPFKTYRGFVFLSAALLALGKTEYSILFLMAYIAAGLFLVYLLKSSQLKSPDDREMVQIMLWSLSGLLVGSLISFIVSPQDVVASLVWINNRKETGIDNSMSQNILTLFNNINFLTPHIILNLILWVLVGVYWLLNHREFSYPGAFLFIFGSALFFSYLISNPLHPRYYTPAYCLFSSTLILFFLKSKRNFYFRSLILVFLTATLLETGFSYRSYYRQSMSDQDFYYNTILPTLDLYHPLSDCIPIMDQAYLYNTDIDYIASSLNTDSQNAILGVFDKTACGVYFSDYEYYLKFFTNEQNNQ